MLKRISFALFDSGETVLSALVFSTFFPLYITEFIDTKTYSLLYGFSFLLSFGLALYFGKLADSKALRKHFFSFFGSAIPVFCMLIGFFYQYPFIALVFFLIMSVLHQQAFVFYNSLLLGFESRGFTSGMGVAFGYVGSAFSLIFLADKLEGKEVYFAVAFFFLVFMIPSLLTVENPTAKGSVELKRLVSEKRFLFLIVSILSVTEVANTLVAMMSIYLREVYQLSSEEIYKIVGLSAIGGVLGGFFWGFLTDKLGVKRVFPAGFALWITFLCILPVIPAELLLLVGFSAGLALSHIWTTSRVFILHEFPASEAAVRMSFLSLTERIASTTGLLIWALFLFLTADNMKLSAFLMIVFPLIGIIAYTAFLKNTNIT